MTDLTFTCADFFCGCGGMVHGYESARAEMLGTRARFKTIFAVDVWPVAAESCERMTGVKVHVADLFTADQYVGFHGERPCWCGSRQRLDACHACPPPDWTEMQPSDLRRLCPGGVRVLKGSPPCKSFSRLLGGDRALTPRYQALNQLVVRWLWLWLEAFPETPPDLILMENVPDIADPRRRKRRRGETVVEQVEAMLQAYGYACRRTTFDCGEIAGLAQHRDRFLLVARRVATTQAPLLEPFKVPMKTIGDVIGDLPPPVGDTGVPMHVLPTRTDLKTKHRLAFVEAGGDWRSIERNWLSAPGWTFAGGVLVPMMDGGEGVADPRLPPNENRHTNKYAVGAWAEQARTVTGGRIGSAANCVEDPRLTCTPNGATLRVVDVDGASPPVIRTSGVWSSGSVQVADVRVNCTPRSGSYGVQELDEPSDTITGSWDVHNGPAAVAAQPPDGVLIAPDWKVWHRTGRWVPRAWHREFTLRELADLQTFPRLDHAGQPLRLAGKLDEQRMQIGNAVPSASARVIAELMLATLLASALGVPVSGGAGIWVRDDGVLRWHATSRQDGRGAEAV